MIHIHKSNRYIEFINTNIYNNYGLINNIFYSKNYGKFKILNYIETSIDRHKIYKIEFLNTNFKTKARLKEILSGSIKDKISVNLKIGSKYKSANCGYFIIDKSDLDTVIVRKWRLWKGRFFTGVKQPIHLTDFLIPDKPKNCVIDHINQKPHDNRRCNLRVTTQSNNTKNRTLMTNNISGFAGIWFDKSRNKWCAEIKTNYIKCFLGRYSDLEDACFVRLVAENIMFGEYRSTTNDLRLVPLANSSKNKDELQKYVEQKLTLKFELAN